jgi:hypothetical protein
MSNDNIVEFNKPEVIEITLEDMDPDKVLRAAIGNLSGCIVIGWTKDDKEEDQMMYMSSSIASGPEVLWLLEKTKNELLNV